MAVLGVMRLNKGGSGTLYGITSGPSMTPPFIRRRNVIKGSFSQFYLGLSTYISVKIEMAWKDQRRNIRLLPSEWNFGNPLERVKETVRLAVE